MTPSPSRHGADVLIERLYGGLVPAPAPARARLLHRHRPQTWPGWLLESWRVEAGTPAWAGWTLQLLRPEAGAAAPVLLSGDACWGHPDDAVKALAVAAGVALAGFNRVELAHDAPDATRAGPVFERHPGARFGALSAWAWAFSRSVDALLGAPGVDPGRIAVVGHSRGGKAALLAGATDTRIALTVAHNSGAGGAASSRVRGPGAESLGALAAGFPHWLATDVAQALQAGVLEGLDQHLLLGRIAPRRLLLIQARGDAWANPEGVRAVAQHARATWRRTGAAGGFALRWREGGHPMGSQDWALAIEAARALPSVEPPR
jgi:dienelactone hydrolase